MPKDKVGSIAPSHFQ